MVYAFRFPRSPGLLALLGLFATTPLGAGAPAGLGKFVRVPPGSFLMGSPPSEPGRRPTETPHWVLLTRAFELGATEVTQAQWVRLTGENPASEQDPRDCPRDFTTINGVGLCRGYPVDRVSWLDAQAFIRKLDALGDGYVYRLPTEAEYEYAARAGSRTAWPFGDDSAELDDYAWHLGNSRGRSHAAGSRRPNAFGLYDLHGNVAQWVQDFDAPYPSEPAVDPTGPTSGSRRVHRGGGWSSAAAETRSAARAATSPALREDGIGFRLVRTPIAPRD